jgi:hypothetical protein
MITEISGVSEDVKVKLNDVLRLQSIMAYRRSDYLVNVDADSTEFPVIAG